MLHLISKDQPFTERKIITNGAHEDNTLKINLVVQKTDEDRRESNESNKDQWH